MLIWFLLLYLGGFVSGVAATIAVLVVLADVLEKAYRPYEGDPNYNGAMYYDEHEKEKARNKNKR